MSISSPEHPLLTAAGVIEAALDDVTEIDAVFLSTGDKATLLVGLTRIAARISALRAEVLAVAEDLADQTADRSPGTWLAGETRTDPREAIADQRLGTTLRHRWPQVRAAARAGQVTWAQAGVISHALDQLPSDPGSADPELVTKAEAHLLAEAGHFGPRQLARLGRKVWEVVAPDLSEAHEHRLLLNEETRAHTATRLHLRPRGDGTTDLHARLPDPIAHRLRTYLDAYTSPRRLTGDATQDATRTPPRTQPWPALTTVP